MRRGFILGIMACLVFCSISIAQNLPASFENKNENRPTDIIVKNKDVEEFNKVLRHISKNKSDAIIIFSGGDWCGACKQFHANTILPMSKKLKTAYVLYTVNVEICKNHSLVKHMKKNGMLKFYPSYIMITNGGKDLVAHGFGNKSQTQFMNWIKKAVYNWKIKKKTQVN